MTTEAPVDSKAVVEALRAARKLIENERDWTQRRMVRVVRPWWDNLFGFQTMKRYQYCAMGAVVAKANGPVEREATRALAFAIRGYLSSRTMLTDWMATITYFNDNHTHAEVLAVFDMAIVVVEKQLITV